ncbi:hypothetical protein BDM02DRAFT_3131226 [Thelephora ganbajun]|uniref:Uncharacterized protein n=1 Tax=Thelephora ganbajun TaxID=370292 RepID=A0ACB6Z6H1_THEGA|nr:hypothetical protein BDM02DRAFT_3131226 [Thelephora ganbajun]
MRLLEKSGSLPIPPIPFTTYAPTLLRFLELCEDYHRNNPISTSIPHVPSQLEPEVTTLQILRSASREEENLFDLTPMLVSVLEKVLRPGDRLQSRALGLELFAGLWHCWSSLLLCGGITHETCAQLVDTIGGLFQPNEVQPSILTEERLRADYGGDIDRFNTVGILLGFALSDAWRGHLRPLNFASCAGIMSLERDRRQVLNALSRLAKIATGFAETQDKSAMFVKGLDRLKGIRSNLCSCIFGRRMKWLKRETLQFFYTHGTEYLDAFAMHIEGCSSTAAATAAFTFRGADGAYRRVRVKDSSRTLGTSELERVPGLQAMCRARGLYQTVR